VGENQSTRAKIATPDQRNHQATYERGKVIIDGKQKSRRRFLKDAAAYGGAVASLSSLPSRASTQPLATNDGPKGTLTQGTIGKLKISRVILGSNLMGGGAHSRDLAYAGPLMQAYHTEAKILETLELAERASINTFLPATGQMPLFNKYRELNSSKMQTICQVFPSAQNLMTETDKSPLLGIICLLITVTLLVAGLWPFNFIPGNKVEWLQNGNGSRFYGQGIVFSQEPLVIQEAASRNASAP
jgi:hypothetical protein